MNRGLILVAALCAVGCSGQPEVDLIQGPKREAQFPAPFEAVCTAQIVQRPAADIDVAMVPDGGMVSSYRHTLVLECPDSMRTPIETVLYLSPSESNPLAHPLDPEKHYTFLLDPRPPWQPELPLLLEIRDGDQTLFHRTIPDGAPGTE